MFKKADIPNFFRQWRNPKQSEINEFVTWARENSVMIEKLGDTTADVEKLSFLDSYLENKRIVYLGEEDHWIHEKSDYRLLLLQYLVSRGWRYIGEELGWSDGIQIDRYLETGEEPTRQITFLRNILLPRPFWVLTASFLYPQGIQRL